MRVHASSRRASSLVKTLRVGERRPGWDGMFPIFFFFFEISLSEVSL